MLDSFKKPFLRSAAACFLLVPALTLHGCASDPDPTENGGGTGGTRDAGTKATDGGTESSGATSAGGSESGGTQSGGTAAGGDSDSGGASEAGATAGGTAAGGTAAGGAASAGTSAGGSTNGGEHWACITGGTSCICQSGAQPKDESVCTGTYPCCFTAPLGPVTRCQCRDPGQSKCSDLAAFTGGEVVTTCPPP